MSGLPYSLSNLPGMLDSQGGANHESQRSVAAMLGAAAMSTSTRGAPLPFDSSTGAIMAALKRKAEEQHLMEQATKRLREASYYGGMGVVSSPGGAIPDVLQQLLQQSAQPSPLPQVDLSTFLLQKGFNTPISSTNESAFQSALLLGNLPASSIDALIAARKQHEQVQQFLSFANSNPMDQLLASMTCKPAAAPQAPKQPDTSVSHMPLASSPRASLQEPSPVGPPPKALRTIALPPCEEGRIAPYTSRAYYPLGCDEDPNWLSEFHCFVRSELLEVFRASHEDCKSRNNSIVYHQVGIRCRFCAHMSTKVGRSSAYPSSLRQIYQSFTMMLRDHFVSCEAMPRAVHDKFLALKDKPSQGATDSKRFWMYSAMKIGMADSSDGIILNEQTIASGKNSAPFGNFPGQRWADDTYRSIPLVVKSDKNLVSEFLYLLMEQVQVVHLTDTERIGNRRSLRLGLPGIACRACCDHHRLGLCRMFPARRRTLPGKIRDVYEHIRRCTVTDPLVQQRLAKLEYQLTPVNDADRDTEKEFYDQVWTRMGHGSV